MPEKQEIQEKTSGQKKIGTGLRAHQNMDLMPWRLVARQRASYFQNRVVKSKILGQLWVFLIEKRNNHENDPGLQIAPLL